MNALPGSVLVVDDDETVRLSYLRSLMATDCNVEAVSDGTKALQKMECHPFDVVMLDLRLPGMDGMSVLRTIKEKWPESEVVVITGLPVHCDCEGCGQTRCVRLSCQARRSGRGVKTTSGAMMQKKWSLHSDRPRSHAC